MFRALCLPATVACVGIDAAMALDYGVDPRVVVVATQVAAVLVVLALERVIPAHASWSRSQGDVRADLWHALLTNGLGAQVGLALSTLGTAGLATHAWPSAAPWIVQLALALVVGELGHYLAHRLLHGTALGFRLHAVHHAPERLYWLNAGREHPLALAFLVVAETAPLLLLGIGPEILVLHLVVRSTVGMFQHANVDVRARWLGWLFSVPEAHRFHHVRDASLRDHNFGGCLAVWDVAFGTHYLPAEPASDDVGLAAGTPPPSPAWRDHVLDPFRHAAPERCERSVR